METTHNLIVGEYVGNRLYYLMGSKKTGRFVEVTDYKGEKWCTNTYGNDISIIDEIKKVWFIRDFEYL